MSDPVNDYLFEHPARDRLPSEALAITAALKIER